MNLNYSLLSFLMDFTDFPYSPFYNDVRGNIHCIDISITSR